MALLCLLLVFAGGEKYGWVTKLADGDGDGDVHRDTLATCYRCFKEVVERNNISMKKRQLPNNNNSSSSSSSVGEWPPNRSNNHHQLYHHQSGGKSSKQNRNKKHANAGDIRKLGYIANELSLLDIKEATNRLKSLQADGVAGVSRGSEDADDEALWKKSFSNLQSAYMHFEEVGDHANEVCSSVCCG